MATVVPLYSSEEYEDLVSRGVVKPDDRVELLEGVIVQMSPQNPPHAGSVYVTAEAVRAAVAGRAMTRVQSPFHAGQFSIPEADVAVIPGQPADYWHKHPTEAHLIVEVANSSLAVDRLTKARVYAAAGVPEYWIVDLVNDGVDVYTGPDPSERRYRRHSRAKRGDLIRPLAFPDAAVAVDDLLGPLPPDPAA